VLYSLWCSFGSLDAAPGESYMQPSFPLDSGSDLVRVHCARAGRTGRSDPPTRGVSHLRATGPL